MSLPSDFHFSQGSLQDFADCPRRFQLRYLLQIAWPAVEAEPYLDNEQFLRLGAAFHLMVQQSLLEVPLERLSAMAQDEPLAGWWQNYLDNQPAAGADRHFPEVTLSAPLGDDGERRLVAKLDLVAISSQQVTIFDWKTSRRRPPRHWLARRWQTRVYPYLLVEAGAELSASGAPQPEQVEMVYWFAGFPDRPEQFRYSQEQHQEDRASIHAQVERIAILSQSDEAFPLTEDVTRCRFCVYRSLCNRGIVAGDLDELEFDDPEPVMGLEFDFEQVGEVAY